MENNNKEERRSAVKKIGGGLLTILKLATLKVGNDLFNEAQPGYKQGIHKLAVEKAGICTSETKQIFESLFLGTKEKIQLIPAKDNPNVFPNPEILKSDPKEVFTYATYEAAKSFGAVIRDIDERIALLDQLLSVDLEGNLITFGSPTSNLIARTVMGYEQIENGKLGCKHLPSDAITFPFLYELDGNAILNSKKKHITCTRNPNDIENVIPNWGYRKNSELVLPETRNGKIIQDYLIITNMPNILNISSFNQDHRIINVGGTHKEGTLAAKQLLSNDNILKRLCSQVETSKGQSSKPKYWQALLLVELAPSHSDKVELKDILDLKPIEVHDRKLARIAEQNTKELS